MNNIAVRSNFTKRKEIYTIIQENRANTEFTVKCLAKDMNISYSYLYEVVYKIFDMSPQRLIETIRLEEAIHLIARGMKLIKLYKKLGYDNIRTFRQAFYKRLGINYSTCRTLIEKANKENKEKIIQQVIAGLWDTDNDCFHAKLSDEQHRI